jgi:tetratricopeptide (TPR) repeat protein
MTGNKPKPAGRAPRSSAGPAVQAKQPPPIATPAWLSYALGFFAVFVCAFIVYSPSLEGQFVFDDLNMPFIDPNARSWPLRVWFGVRPLLMTTFWVNLHLSDGKSTFAYHAVNVVFHSIAGILVFFVLRRILEWTKTANRDLLAGFGCAIFLLHPIQTEAVSYIAQRGEDMGACLYLGAYCLFIYRKPGAVSWVRAFSIFALFGAAVITKEHTVTLPALLLLTDYFFNPGFTFEGIKRNWRLYAPMVAGLFMAVGLAAYYLKGDKASVGFQLPEFNGIQYLFTQFRVFFAYTALFLYPLWQTIDYDFPVTKNLLDPGSLVALAALLGLLYAAFRYRRRFPLASFGFLTFGALLLPTSSVLPIRDVIADRRLYLPMIGLLFIALEFLRRWKPGRTALIATFSCVSLLMAAGTYQRNEKWKNAVSLWADAVEKNPDKARVQFGLAATEFMAKQCHESIPHYEKAIELTKKPDYQLEMNLGLAEQCDNHPQEAVAALRRSIAIQPSAQAWSSLGLVEANQGHLDAALDALKQAEAVKPNYVMTFIYRGGILQAAGRIPEATAQFQHALDLEPGNEVAKGALAQIRH